MSSGYLFTSQRLGFRGWQTDDIGQMAAINADPQVMEFFPSVKTREETRDFIERMQVQLAAKGYCYYAVIELATGELIGFTGISDQTFDAPFTPCTDIGWRLGAKYWYKGYATEAAKRCLQYAADELGMTRINAVAPIVNTRSIQVMKKIGMKKVSYFAHPLLVDDERLRQCVLYEIHL